MNDRITYSGKRCAVCGHPTPDEHHVKTKGAARKEVRENEVNKINLCRQHHTECHAIGRWSFALKYKLLKEFIDALGNVKFEQWLATQTEEIKNEVKSAIENKSEVEHG